MDNEQRFSVPLSLMNAITTFLGRHSWNEVNGMMAAIANPDIVRPIEPEKTTENENQKEK